MKSIAVVTATRAEYGILTPLIKRIMNDAELELQLLVTGTHLSKKHGETVRFIEADGVEIAAKIPILEDGNDPHSVSVTAANAICGFAAYFKKNRPDMLVILGDRTEMLGIAFAAMNEHIPIAHIHGGELTEGAVDDCVRHSLTKMSYLHFASTEEYRKRIIQLGEAPDRVFNVGALSTENILKYPLMGEEEIRNDIGVINGGRYGVVTFHPVTLENEDPIKQTEMLCRIMEQRRDIFFVITGANADAGGDEINRLLSECAKCNDNMTYVETLGMKRYLSAVKYAAFVLGNSSSGIIEAPVLGTPTVNIGDRQKGRLIAETVICCSQDEKAIAQAIDKALLMEHKSTRMFGVGNTSEKIVQQIKVVLNKNKIDLKKVFYDL